MLRSWTQQLKAMLAGSAVVQDEVTLESIFAMMDDEYREEYERKVLCAVCHQGAAPRVWSIWVIGRTPIPPAKSSLSFPFVTPLCRKLVQAPCNHSTVSMHPYPNASMLHRAL
jgi:hypothetical protein